MGSEMCIRDRPNVGLVFIKLKLCCRVEAEEKIQAHVLSIWREGRGFFSGKGREGMLILTNKNLCFIKKTEAPMKWWGAIRTRQKVRLLQS